jgi:hypothetical protein
MKLHHLLGASDGIRCNSRIPVNSSLRGQYLEYLVSPSQLGTTNYTLHSINTTRSEVRTTMDVRDGPPLPLANKYMLTSQSVSTYSVASLVWLTTQAVPLIIWPSLVSTLLRVDSPQYAGVANASLEQYFARSLGLSQLALAGLLLVLSGALPLDSIVEGPLSPPPPFLLPSTPPY